MEKVSEEEWKEILNNQKLPLFGTNLPHEGNGYNDGVSFQIPYDLIHGANSDIYTNVLFSNYFSDLHLYLDPSYSRHEKFEKGLLIKNCTSDYLKTLQLYILRTSDYGFRDKVLKALGQWGYDLLYYGIVILEFVSWYDNDSNQFYGFELRKLNSDFCTIKKKHIVYNAPYFNEERIAATKEVLIPIKKCIIIEFPKELGGYKNHQKVVREVLKLGSQFTSIDSPVEMINHSKNWDKKYNKILAPWGTLKRIDNITEFYAECNYFKFMQTVVLCTHSLIDGLKGVVNLLNERLKEEATVEFYIQRYDIAYFREMQSKWMKGELSFKEANEFLTF
jgi:hypothetical protein